MELSFHVEAYSLSRLLDGECNRRQLAGGKLSSRNVALLSPPSTVLCSQPNHFRCVQDLTIFQHTPRSSVYTCYRELQRTTSLDEALFHLSQETLLESLSPCAESLKASHGSTLSYPRPRVYRCQELNCVPTKKNTLWWQPPLLMKKWPYLTPSSLKFVIQLG